VLTAIEPYISARSTENNDENVTFGQKLRVSFVLVFLLLPEYWIRSSVHALTLYCASLHSYTLYLVHSILASSVSHSSGSAVTSTTPYPRYHVFSYVHRPDECLHVHASQRPAGTRSVIHAAAASAYDDSADAASTYSDDDAI